MSVEGPVNCIKDRKGECERGPVPAFMKKGDVGLPSDNMCVPHAAVRVLYV